MKFVLFVVLSLAVVAPLNMAKADGDNTPVVACSPCQGTQWCTVSVNGVAVEMYEQACFDY